MARGFSYAPGASDEVPEASAPELAKERMTELGASRNAVVREAIAARTDLPFGLMVTLAHDSAPGVRAAMAANPRVLQSLLEHLSHDRHVDVLRAVTQNPTVTPVLLDALAGHRKPEVRDAAVAALDAQREAAAQVDDGTPELRDRVFEESQARLEALLGGTSAGAGAGAGADAAAATPAAAAHGAQAGRS